MYVFVSVAGQSKIATNSRREVSEVCVHWRRGPGGDALAYARGSWASRVGPQYPIVPSGE
jgi:hypothetical protein